jgi:hypothetical protein
MKKKKKENLHRPKRRQFSSSPLAPASICNETLVSNNRTQKKRKDLQMAQATLDASLRPVFIISTLYVKHYNPYILK